MPDFESPANETSAHDAALSTSATTTTTIASSPRATAPSVTKHSTESGRPRRWNTADLGWRLGADLASAATASALIAPVISVIDRSIVEKAATGTPFSVCLLRSLRPALARPPVFLSSRPFLLIFILYAGTYSTANAVDTFSSIVAGKPAHTVTSGPIKFVATSSVNMSLCVYKDSCFAKMFGARSAAPAAAVPRLSYALFALRDSLTIFASFNLPPWIAPHLKNLPPAVKSTFLRVLDTEKGRANTAQFLAPAAIQLISTPIHLLGLDLYNRQGLLGVRERVARILRDWGVSTLARMGRIIPAFGAGGVVNARLRQHLMETIETPQHRP